MEPPRDARSLPRAPAAALPPRSPPLRAARLHRRETVVDAIEQVRLLGRRRDPHPHEPLREARVGVHAARIVLEPLELTQYRLAKEISVPARRINEIVHGTRAISADTALRLARYFGTSDEFWLNLQMRYDLEVERDRLGPRLRKEVAVLKRAG